MMIFSLEEAKSFMTEQVMYGLEPNTKVCIDIISEQGHLPIFQLKLTIQSIILVGITILILVKNASIQQFKKSTIFSAFHPNKDLLKILFIWCIPTLVSSIIAYPRDHYLILQIPLYLILTVVFIDSILKIKDFNDSIFNNNILTSALWNVAIKLSNNNQINFKNLFSLNTDDKVVVRNGLFDATAPIWEKSNVRWFTQNRIYTSQLQGDHFLPNQKIKIKWVGGYSNISRNIPNLRKMVYQKSGGLENDSFKYAALIDANTVLPNSAGSMFFSKNNEQIKSLGYDLSKNIS